MPQSRPRFTFLATSTVEAAAEAARDRGVSEVATGPGGFVEAFLSVEAPDELHDFGPEGDNGISWYDKRMGFLKRHWAQAQRESMWEVSSGQARPTRRALALAVWAWHPEPGKLRRWLERAGYMG